MNPPICPNCGRADGYQRHITETATTHMTVGPDTASATERMLHTNPAPWSCNYCQQAVMSWDHEQLVNLAFQKNGGLV